MLETLNLELDFNRFYWYIYCRLRWIRPEKHSLKQWSDFFNETVPCLSLSLSRQYSSATLLRFGGRTSLQAKGSWFTPGAFLMPVYHPRANRGSWGFLCGLAAVSQALSLRFRATILVKLIRLWGMSSLGSYDEEDMSFCDLTMKMECLSFGGSSTKRILGKTG